MKKRKAQPEHEVPGLSLRCAERLYRAALEAEHPDVRAGLLHLGDLYRHCPTYYPNLNIRESDGLPLKASHSSSAGFGSPGAMCVEG